MNIMNRVEKNSTVALIGKGYIIAIIITIVSLFIYAVLLVNTSIQENTMKAVVMAITGVSILIGSSISSLKIKKNGIINGLCVGGLYIISLYILSSIALVGFSLNLNSIIMILISIILGGIGGIIGVNIGR